MAHPFREMDIPNKYDLALYKPGKFFLLGDPIFMSKVPRIGEKFLIGIFKLI
jgi:hypothetical protein